MCDISIHALVKRATRRIYHGKAWKVISIHALVKRATFNDELKEITNEYFNPRPRKEGDRIPAGIIFIHAYFNPRPRKEGDV